MAQQYGYGYGYQPYNYAQPAPVPQGQSYGGYNTPAASGHTNYGQSPASVPQQQQQQPSVGYSSYTHGSQSSVTPSPCESSSCGMFVLGSIEDHVNCTDPGLSCEHLDT